MRTKTGWFKPAIHWRQIQTGSFFRESATKVCPATGERFVPLRKLAQQLESNSNPCESSPSRWGTIRTPAKACPAAGERFALRESSPSCWGAIRAPRKSAQQLGNNSRSAKACPAAGERFALRESFPSYWGANRAPCEIQLSHWMKKLIYDDNNRIIRF